MFGLNFNTILTLLDKLLKALERYVEQEQTKLNDLDKKIVELQAQREGKAATVENASRILNNVKTNVL